MRKKRKELTRTAAMFLASLLTVNSIDLPAFTADDAYVVYAAQAEDVPGTTEQAENADKKEATGHRLRLQALPVWRKALQINSLPLEQARKSISV